MLAQLQTSLGPRIEVVAHSDGTTGALLLADRPVLVEGLGAVDGRLVVAGSLVDVVGGAVGGDGAETLGARRRVVGAKVLDDVVLDKRVAGPAVDGQVAVAGGVELTRVGDGASRTGVPALAGDEVADVLPVHRVRAAVAVVVVDIAAAVGPEGVVEAVVEAGAAGGAGAHVELGELGGVEGDGEGTGGAEEEGLDGDHCV